MLSPGALRPQLSQVRQEGAEQRGARHGGDYDSNHARRELLLTLTLTLTLTATLTPNPDPKQVEAMDVFLTPRRISHSLALGHIALPPATPGWSEIYPEFLVITQVSSERLVVCSLG